MLLASELYLILARQQTDTEHLKIVWRVKISKRELCLISQTKLQQEDSYFQGAQTNRKVRVT